MERNGSSEREEDKIRVIRRDPARVCPDLQHNMANRPTETLQLKVLTTGRSVVIALGVRVFLPHVFHGKYNTFWVTFLCHRQSFICSLVLVKSSMQKTRSTKIRPLANKPEAKPEDARQPPGDQHQTPKQHHEVNPPST